MGKMKEVKNKVKDVPYTLFPSPYGSHASMVDEALTAELADPKKVVCRDEYGTYVTDRSYLDCGLADPYRNDCGRFEELCRNKGRGD